MVGKRIAWAVIGLSVFISFVLIGLAVMDNKNEEKVPLIDYPFFVDWAELGIFSEGDIVNKSASFLGARNVGYLHVGSKSELQGVHLWSEKGELRLEQGKVNFGQPIDKSNTREIILENATLDIWMGKLLYLGGNGETEFGITTIKIKKGKISLDGVNGFFALNPENLNEASVGSFTIWINEGTILPKNKALIILKSPYEIRQGELVVKEGLLDLKDVILGIKNTTITYSPEGIIKIELPNENKVFQTGSLVRTNISATATYDPVDWLKTKGIKANPIKAIAFDIVAMYAVPVLWTLAMFVWIFRGGGMQAFGGAFEEFKAKRFLGSKFKLKDFAGKPEIKKEFEELVFYCMNPKKYGELGIRPPRAVLLTGPPGTGKTYLARCIAGEVEGNVLYQSGPSFSRKWMGEAPEAVRKIFDQAKKLSRKTKRAVIVIIDEIDAVLRIRQAASSHGEREAERASEEFFAEMDGLATAEEGEVVIIIGMTNRPDVLDPAALRSGRFDWQFEITRPDSAEARLEIFEVHANGKKISPDVDRQAIAREIYGFTGADIEKLINEAGRFSIRRTIKGVFKGRLEKTEITMADFQSAIDRVMLGTERELLLDERTKRGTAEHEVGHALPALLDFDSTPVRFISLVPRIHSGGDLSLGLTYPLPAKEIYGRTLKMWEASLVFMVGGRAAEMVVSSKSDPGLVSDGAVSDIRKATATARLMVRSFGLSELGFFNFNDNIDLWSGQQIKVSEQTLREVDLEERRLINAALEKAKEVIHQNRSIFDALVEALLKEKELDSKQLEEVLKKIKPDKKFNLFHLALAEAEKEKQNEELKKALP